MSNDKQTPEKSLKDRKSEEKDIIYYYLILYAIDKDENKGKGNDKRLKRPRVEQCHNELKKYWGDDQCFHNEEQISALFNNWRSKEIPDESITRLKKNKKLLPIHDLKSQFPQFSLGNLQHPPYSLPNDQKKKPLFKLVPSSLLSDKAEIIYITMPNSNIESFQPKLQLKLISQPESVVSIPPQPNVSRINSEPPTNDLSSRSLIPDQAKYPYDANISSVPSRAPSLFDQIPDHSSNPNNSEPYQNFQWPQSNSPTPSRSSSDGPSSSFERMNFRSSTNVVFVTETKENLYETITEKIDNINMNSSHATEKLYKKLKSCYSALSKSNGVFLKERENRTKSDTIENEQKVASEKSDINDEVCVDDDILNFEKAAEKQFMDIIFAFMKLGKQSIDSNNIYCSTNMNIPPCKMSGSFVPIDYNSRTSSLADNQSSADLTIKGQNRIVKDEIREPIKFNLNFEYDVFTRLKSLRQFDCNNKLLSFLEFDHDEGDFVSYEFENIELSTIVAFNVEFVAWSQFMFCYPAFVYYSEGRQSFILQLKDIETDTGFKKSVNSIIFDRRSTTNRIFVCGDDSCVKEFTIIGLDEYIKCTFSGIFHPAHWNLRDDQDHSMEREMVHFLNTKTYKIKGNAQIDRSSLVVWQDELVMGFKDTLVFWVDEDESDRLTIENIKKIGCLKVFGNFNSYLAVSSEAYPVIYIYNKEHQNIRRLVSHTKGVTSLASYGLYLFSGSLDTTARLWDVDGGVTMSIMSTVTQEISAIGSGIYEDYLFLFTAGEDGTIDCWSINTKSIQFKIKLKENIVPKEIFFGSFHNDAKDGDVARLIVLSESESCDSGAKQHKKKNTYFQMFQFS